MLENKLKDVLILEGTVEEYDLEKRRLFVRIKTCETCSAKAPIKVVDGKNPLDFPIGTKVIVDYGLTQLGKLELPVLIRAYLEDQIIADNYPGKTYERKSPN